MNTKKPHRDPATGWGMAVHLLADYLERKQRLDFLLERADTLPGPEQSRCRRHLVGAIRHLGRIRASIDPLTRRVPRPRVRAILYLAGFEILDGGPAGAPLAVDHAVRNARRIAGTAESGMVNAVLRKAIPSLTRTMPPSSDPGALALHYSHPSWLVESWIRRWGVEAVEQLLTWNQTPPQIHARGGPGDEPPLPGAVATRWAGYWRLDGVRWPDIRAALNRGALYLADPATRLAPEAMDPKPGERLLDLCAAPGGKTIALAEEVGAGRVTAIDLPGPRMERLRRNLAMRPHLQVDCFAANLLELTPGELKEAGLPERYDGVLLDAPCSNTGVLRHRPDVKWRLDPRDPEKVASLQQQLLRRAASFVRPGGRLVYSTCSLESEENETVAAAFGDSQPEFTMVTGGIHLPWETGHDGAGIFLFVRSRL